MAKILRLEFADLSLSEGAFRVYSAIELSSIRQERDKSTAQILSTIPGFVERVNEARKANSVALEPLTHMSSFKRTSYGVSLNKDDASKILFHHSTNPRLLSAARSILTSFRLSERWLDAILTLIRNDSLVLPTDAMVTATLTDEPMYKLSKQLESINSADKKTHSNELIITVTERMSPTELANWIKTSSSVKSKLQKLQKTPTSLLGVKPSKTMYWGEAVWAYKEYVDGDASYRTIEKWLEDKHPESMDVPESRALATYYKRFREARKKYPL